MAFSGVIYWVAYQLLGTQDLFLFFIETYTRLTHIVFADYHAPSYRALALYVQVTMPLVTMPLVTMPLVTMPSHFICRFASGSVFDAQVCQPIQFNIDQVPCP